MTYPSPEFDLVFVLQLACPTFCGFAIQRFNAQNIVQFGQDNQLTTQLTWLIK
jgi:hypothetical protein